MPRLIVEEPPQHGRSTGSAIKRRREKSPVVPRKLRSRSISPAVLDTAPRAVRKRRKPMSKDRQAALAVRALEIKSSYPKGKKRRVAMQQLTAEFECGEEYPRKVLKDLQAKQKLPRTRAGVGQRRYKISAEDGRMIRPIFYAQRASI